MTTAVSTCALGERRLGMGSPSLIVALANPRIYRSAQAYLSGNIRLEFVSA